MGFPPLGFSLYRKENGYKNTICLSPQDFENVPLRTPLVHKVNEGQTKNTITFRASKVTLETIHPNSPRSIRFFIFEDELSVTLKSPVSAIEVEYLTTGGKYPLDISVYSKNALIYSEKVSGKAFQKKRFFFNAKNINKIKFKGGMVQIAKLCFIGCHSKGKWIGPINTSCGVGLPFGPKSAENLSKELLKLPPESDSTTVATSMVTCRLDRESQSEEARLIELREIGELEELLGEIKNEGVDVPIGWNITEGENDDDKEASFAIAPYDMLLLLMQQVKLAKSLGLYWTDKSAKPHRIYDYKIVGNWPKGTLWNLEHHTTFDDSEIKRSFFFSVVHKDSLTLIGPNPSVVEAEHEWARSTHGLTFSPSSQGTVKIIFAEPVAEVQIFYMLKSPGDVEFKAYKTTSSSPIDTTTSDKMKGVLALHGEEIQIVTISTTNITILRICHDTEYIPYGTHEKIICGLKSNSSTPLSYPQKPSATPLPPLVRTDIPSKTFPVSLRWEVNKTRTNTLLAYGAVGTHAKRDDEKITELPISLNALDFDREEEENSPFITDYVEEPGTYNYYFAHVDLFDRQSNWSRAATAQVEEALPPPPQNVQAKFLDYTTYDPIEHTSSDVMLNDKEIEWLQRHQKSVLKVSWEWSPTQQSLFPNITTFNIFLKKGWLNLMQGTIQSVEHRDPSSEDTASFQYHECTIKGDRPYGEGALKGEWMRQGNGLFMIESNEENPSSRATKIDLKRSGSEQSFPPVTDKMFTISLTKTSEQGGIALDYLLPTNWDEESIAVNISELESYTDSGVIHYTYYWELPSSTQFPMWHYNNDTSKKTEYVQLGVSSVNGAGVGSVSRPATAMAIDRTPPEQVTWRDIEGHTASYANIYGKSFYALTFKAEQGLKYDIYRAMDETVFLTDQGRTHSDYTDLSNEALKALASDERNLKAFTKINTDSVVPEESGDYTYIDDSLDGHSQNRYFYRVQAINEIEARGPFSEATPPVQVPLSTPPSTPIVNKTIGENQRVTFFWVNPNDPSIKAIRFYRTKNPADLVDSRKMKLVHTFLINDTSPELSWSDDSVVAGDTYYYRVVAVNHADFLSLPTEPIRMTIVDANPPPMPEEVTQAWAGNTIHLQWKCSALDATFIIKRKQLGAIIWKPLQVEGAYQKLSPTEYEYYDTDVSEGESYAYRIMTVSKTKVRSEAYAVT